MMTPINANPKNEFEIAGAAVEIVKNLDPASRQLWLWYGMGLIEGRKNANVSAEHVEPDASQRR